MAGFIYKPVSTGQQNRGGASFLLSNANVKNVGVYDSKGNKIEDLQTGVTEGGLTKFYSSKPGTSYGSGFTFRYTDETGKVQNYNIKDSKTAWEGEYNNPDSLQVRAGGSGSSGGGKYAPTQVGNYGFAPAYVGGEFPKASLSKYKNIKSAPYKFTDPIEFAKKFGNFNRDEINKNSEQANNLALDQLDTELEGMQKFTPAAAALQREQVSLDNAFNQKQRTNQVNQALPGAEEDLAGQRNRANAYASGKLPNSLDDAAYEMGARSNSADASSFGGFGATSSVARKASDLMSVNQRLQLSQYGDQLLSSNIGQRANLFLAPTEYSNAGSQVRVMPTLSGSQLAQSNLSNINNATLLSPSQALSTEVQQNQFTTSLEQGTREFNASNNLANSQFNANTQNQFKLGKFQYDVGYAGAVAGAAQTNSNTEVAISQQDKASAVYQQYLQKAQEAGTANAISQIGGAVVGGIGNIIKGLGSSDSGSGSGESSTGKTIGGSTDAPIVSGPDVSPVSNSASELPASDPNSSNFVGPQQPSATPSEQITGSSDNSSYSGDVLQSASRGSLAGPVYHQAAVAGNFSADTGMQGALLQDPQQPVTRQLLASAGGVLNAAGMSYTQQQGMVSAGYDRTGREVFTAPSIHSSNDASIGGHIVDSITNAIDPFNALNAKDHETLKGIGSAASDVSFLATLDGLHQNGDAKGFTNALVNRFGPGAVKSFTDNPTSKDAIDTGFASYNLFMNWDKMSAAQKSAGVAALGINGYKTATGVNLANVDIIKPTFKSVDGKSVLDTPGLKLGTAVQMLNAGINVYNMATNWDQMSNIQKIAAGTGTVSEMASLANTFHLLGTGTSGAAVSTSSLNAATQLVNSGAAQAVQPFGVGALNLASNAEVPAGYMAVATAKEGGTIIVPTSNASSALGAISAVAGAASFAMGAKQVYDGWGTGGAKGRLNGAIGGAAMAGGLYAMGSSSLMSGTLLASAATGPFAPLVLGGVMAAALLSNSIKVGKSGDQMGRDQVRSAMQSNGLVDSNFKVTLADGTQADVGIDGHAGLHTAAHQDKLTENDKSRSGDNKLNAWDVDYTNDLDYLAGTGGIALSRLLIGETGKHSDQMGGQLGNAALANIGYGKDLNQNTFGAMTANLRAMYAKSGIVDKASAYQLANQAFAEKRINDSDLASMHKTFDIIYDKGGYDTARQLMPGRFQGVKLAVDNKDKDPTPAYASAPANGQEPISANDKLRSGVSGSTALDAFKKLTGVSDVNLEKVSSSESKPYASSGNATDSRIPGATQTKLPKPNAPIVFQSRNMKSRSVPLTKEEVRARNQAMYASEAA